jgi:hypothetical protein
VKDQQTGGHSENIAFQATIVEGCQGLYNEMKAIEGGLNALQQSTVQLAYKHQDVVVALNTTN